MPMLKVNDFGISLVSYSRLPIQSVLMTITLFSSEQSRVLVVLVLVH